MNDDSTKFLQALADGYQKAEVAVQDGLLLAVSGGADSLALLYGTLALWPERVDQIAIAHVNHGLRGEASQEDAVFVEAIAGQLGVRSESLTVEEGGLQNDRAGSLEAAARNVRYQFLKETAASLKLSSVVTAHHFDDQAETILHNILRGTGLRGLAGMRPSRPLHERVSLARPMLQIRSSEVHNYLKALGASYQIDASNKDINFTRNRIRNELLPELREKYSPTVDRHVVSLAAQADESVKMLDLFASKVLSEVMLEQTPGMCRIDRKKFADWPEDVRRYCLALLWIHQQWPRQKMKTRSYVALATAVGNAEVQRGDLPGGVRFEVSCDILRLVRN